MTTVRVPIRAPLLTWASKRSRIAPDMLASRFPDLRAWEQGEKQPTLKQLEKFANATHTPIGYLFLTEPPEERLPVPDIRTIGDVQVGEASPDLLDTVYLCQQRQDRYRDYARLRREGSVPFVGTLTTNMDVVEAAQTMQDILAYQPWDRGSSWTEALRSLIEASDRQGILVMVSSVVGSNTRRKLDPVEFRGFALVDELAPLVFVNGADTKAAQIFTLAHELAHIWLGQSAVSDVDVAISSANDVERWCNALAAEFLVPLDALGHVDVERPDLTGELERVARIFKVSTLVVLRRIFDAGLITEARYRSAYVRERDRVLAMADSRRSDGGGGDFYNTLPVRVSKRFARAIVESTREGQTLYSDAYHMLGFKKHATFEELATRLGFA